MIQAVVSILIFFPSDPDTIGLFLKVAIAWIMGAQLGKLRQATSWWPALRGGGGGRKIIYCNIYF
jgi:hypothetical protein